MVAVKKNKKGRNIYRCKGRVRIPPKVLEEKIRWELAAGWPFSCRSNVSCYSKDYRVRQQKSDAQNFINKKHFKNRYKTKNYFFLNISISNFVLIKRQLYE